MVTNVFNNIQLTDDMLDQIANAKIQTSNSYPLQCGSTSSSNIMGTIYPQITTTTTSIQQSILQQALAQASLNKSVPQQLISMEKFLVGTVDFTKDVYFYNSELTELILWRFFLWAYARKEEYSDYALMADNMSLHKYQSHQKYVVIAFNRNDILNNFNDWLESYNNRFGINTKIPTPETSGLKVDGYLIKHEHKMNILNETQPFMISENLIKEWSWIVENVKYPVTMLSDYWIFQNEGDAVHFKLAVDKLDK
jgi:hypothetical protein